jgi:fluoride exporter
MGGLRGISVYWYVAGGSAIGGVLRMLLSGAVHQRTAILPSGTLTVNILGSFLVGLIARYAAESTGVSPEARAFLITGFCGGFTTFSAFSLEATTLLELGDYRHAALYSLASVVLCGAATFGGFAAARALFATLSR